MLSGVVVASLAAVVTGAAALLVPRRLRPSSAARLITALVLLSFGAAVWTLILLVTSDVVQLHGVAQRLARLSQSTDAAIRHRHSLTPIGFVALSAVVATAVSVIRVFVRQRRRPAPIGDRELAIIASDVPVAYALPGRPGQVVISTAMLRSLDPQERRVLLAHERSHLRRGHHYYIYLTEFAVAVLPVLAPLNARLRFAIERWADEDAAEEVGDRALVASAIARAALASNPTPRLGLAMADSGVVERVQFMLAGPPRRSPVIEAFFGAMVLVGLAGFVSSLLLIGSSLLVALGLQ